MPRIAVVVEGQGDRASVRGLLQRIWLEVLGQSTYLEIRLFMGKRDLLLTEIGLREVVEQAGIRLRKLGDPKDRRLILVLIDAERDGCPKELATQLLPWARGAVGDIEVACVFANPMFETWFVAAASSLAGVHGLPSELEVPIDPEENRIGKSWIDHQMRSVKQNRHYKEKLDQPAMAALFDLQLCRANSPSFDKLCRELERLATAVPSP